VIDTKKNMNWGAKAAWSAVNLGVLHLMVFSFTMVAFILTVLLKRHLAFPKPMSTKWLPCTVI